MPLTAANGRVHCGAVVRRSSIFLLSSEALFREGVTELLRRHGHRQVSSFPDEATLRAATTAPDVLIVDLDHEPEDLTSVVGRLRKKFPGSHFVMIGSSLRQAAANIPADEIIETPGATSRDLEAVTRGRRMVPTIALVKELRRWQSVTPRQRDVLRLLAVGFDNLAIAKRLEIGERAVKNHITHLLDQFELENRTQLALLARHAGLRPTT